MGLGLWIARSAAATVLGLIVFASFLSFFLVNHINNRLLDDDLYIETLRQHNAYNRIYTEVLLDQRVGDSVQDLTGDFQIATHEEIVEVLAEIVPPQYAQTQIEQNIRRIIHYLNEDTGSLSLQVELGPPLARAKPALFEYIDGRIDQLATVQPDANLSLLEQVAEVRATTEAALLSLAQGQVPEAIPSVRAIPQPLRADLFNTLLPKLLNDPGLDPRVRQGLNANRREIRETFVAGDTREFLKASARAALELIVDQAIDQVGQNLDSQGRLDVIATIGRNNADVTEETLRADLADFRDGVNRAQMWGTTLALVIGILATVIMMLIYLPSLSNMLRWPGLTLLLTGTVLFVLGKIVENTLPARLNNVIDREIARASELPPPAVDLATDVLHSLVQQLVQGVATPALVLLILGAVLLVASFLVVFLKPYVPGIK